MFSILGKITSFLQLITRLLRFEKVSRSSCINKIQCLDHMFLVFWVSLKLKPKNPNSLKLTLYCMQSDAKGYGNLSSEIN